MSNWTSGYVADIGYTFGYYRELNPLSASFPLLSSGVIPPPIRTACELGFGQGLSTNIHAAASDIDWYGTDFNPSQAGFARELASVSGANANLYDEAFQDFCYREDLPNFDLIVMHGIWSWVSDENRKILVDFIRRKLNVGGALYISYNTQPGWAAFAPMRHLMTQHAEIVGSTGSGTISRVDGALEFAEKLLGTNPSYGAANPQVKERIKYLKSQSRHYLAHEYFNRDWEPMHFSAMARWLESAKLEFACSAYTVNHLDSINMTPQQGEFLHGIPDIVLKESVKDFMTNSTFRRDYWIKGKRKYSALEKLEELRRHKVVLCVDREGLQVKVSGALGEATLNDAIYEPLLDSLAGNKVRTIAEVESELSNNGNIGLSEILECMLILIGKGYVATAQDESVSSAVRKRTDPLNLHILNKTKLGQEIVHLASPVLGGGFPVTQLQQHFLLAYKEGEKTEKGLADKTWEYLSALGQKLQLGEKILDSVEDNKAKLLTDAKVFLDRELPILKALKIA